ncbi:MAG: fumarylacetoacetate hydrolase family protein [Hyphomicrobiales bacterium]|nr:fumarylacetoacetate hydrolase family protein [Hyphomicrobiales bacterium]
MGYKLVTYQSSDGPRAGIVLGERVVDIARATRVNCDVSVDGILMDWQKAKNRLAALTTRKGLRGQALAKTKLLAPIPRPGAIYCAGSNYADHAAEMARAAGREPPADPHDLGLRSWHFIKSSRAVTAPGATVKMPSNAKKVDWEVELAVVIGRKCKDVAEKDAYRYIAGYTIANDLSARDRGQREAMPATSAFRFDWTAHKSFDGSCPMGPWIVPASEIKDPMDLELQLEVSGEMKQDSNTGHMIFNIREQIADLASKITLWPGDIIMTGTPDGVGNGRGEFLKAGDVVKARVEGIGELVTRMS